MGRKCGSCCGDCCPCYEIIETFDLDPCETKYFDYGNKCGQFDVPILKPRNNYKCIEENNNRDRADQILNDDGGGEYITKISELPSNRSNNSNYNSNCTDSRCQKYPRSWGIFEKNKLCLAPLLSGPISCTGAMIDLLRFYYKPECSKDNLEATFHLVVFCDEHKNLDGGLKLKIGEKCNKCYKKCKRNKSNFTYSSYSFGRINGEYYNFPDISKSIQALKSSFWNEEEFDCYGCKKDESDDSYKWCLIYLKKQHDKTVSLSSQKDNLCITKCGPFDSHGVPIGMDLEFVDSKDYCVPYSSHGMISLNYNGSEIFAHISDNLSIDSFTEKPIENSIDTWTLKLIDGLHNWEKINLKQEDSGNKFYVKSGIFNLDSKPQIKIEIGIESLHYEETHTFTTFPLCNYIDGKINCTSINDLDISDFESIATSFRNKTTEITVNKTSLIIDTSKVKFTCESKAPVIRFQNNDYPDYDLNQMVVYCDDGEDKTCADFNINRLYENRVNCSESTNAYQEYAYFSGPKIFRMECPSKVFANNLYHLYSKEDYGFLRKAVPIDFSPQGLNAILCSWTDEVVYNVPYELFTEDFEIFGNLNYTLGDKTMSLEVTRENCDPDGFLKSPWWITNRIFLPLTNPCRDSEGPTVTFDYEHPGGLLYERKNIACFKPRSSFSCSCVDSRYWWPEGSHWPQLLVGVGDSLGDTQCLDGARNANVLLETYKDNWTLINTYTQIFTSEGSNSFSSSSSTLNGPVDQSFSATCFGGKYYITHSNTSGTTTRICSACESVCTDAFSSTKNLRLSTKIKQHIIESNRAIQIAMSPCKFTSIDIEIEEDCDKYTEAP